MANFFRGIVVMKSIMENGGGQGLLDYWGNTSTTSTTGTAFASFKQLWKEPE